MEVFSWAILTVVGLVGVCRFVAKMPKETKYITMSNNIPTSHFIIKMEKNKKYY